MPDQTNQSNQVTTAELLQQVCEGLPEDFVSVEPEMKMHHLIMVASKVFNVPGDWVLVDGSRTLLELLQEK